MNGRTTVWVERDVQNRIIRVFKSSKTPEFYLAMNEGRAFTCPKKDAISAIWNAVFDRAQGKCEYGCGRTITRSGRTKMELHEQVPRGKALADGEYSMENSFGLCSQCHKHDERGHANRRLHWSEET